MVRTAGMWLLISPGLLLAQSVGPDSRIDPKLRPVAASIQNAPVHPSLPKLKEPPQPPAKSATDDKVPKEPSQPPSQSAPDGKILPPPALADFPDPRNPPAVQGSALSNVSRILTLDEVLQSVETHYPLLRAIELERQIAQARYLSSQGAFDTNLRVGTLNQPQYSTFENYRFNIGVDQAFSHSGITAFGTYRGGYGDFPIYYGERKTADGGEFRGGLNIPFLRDSAIDRRRANLQQASIGVAAAEPTIQRQRIDFIRGGARAYWNWITAGLSVDFSRELVELARERDTQLAALVKGGVIARQERLLNQSTIVDRNSVLVSAQSRLQQTSIDLSLYLRDERGEPMIPTTNRLPVLPRNPRGRIDLESARKLLPDPIAVDSNAFGFALQTAFENRPELRRIQLQKETLGVELAWAKNQTLPALNGFLASSSDLGPSSPRSGPSRLDRATLEVGVELQLPVQRRDARGRVLAAEAELARLTQQEQFARDTIRAEVQATFANLERAYEFYRQTSARVSLAREVADIARKDFEVGGGDVLRITLLEQQEFQSILTEVTARFDYFRLLAEYQAALGMGAK